MNEFKPIETQEQLDAIIGERVKRAKESVRKEFADYEKYKEAFDNQETFKQSFEEQIANLEKEREGLNSRIAKYERDSVKIKACNDYGLPIEMASRLHGDTEEDIMRDASTLVNFVKTKVSPPLRNPEAKSEDGVTSAFRKLNPDIKI